MTMYDRIRISFDRNTTRNMIDMLHHSLGTLANKKGYVAPAIVQRDV